MTVLLHLLILLLVLPGLARSQTQVINGNRVQSGWVNYGLTTGTGGSYVLTLAPALPAYVDGTCFLFRAHVANTGDATLNVNGKGAIPLRKWSGGTAVPLSAGDISAQQDVEVCYDSTGNRMQVFGVGGATGTGVTDGDKTDITVSGSGTIWTIDTSAVTYAKLQQTSAAAVLLGRGSAAGAGAVQEITLGANLSMAGTTLNAAGAAGVADGDKGNITVSGGGTTWTIDNSVVTYAKLQSTVGAPILLGRGAVGPGVLQEITLGTNLSMTGTTLHAAGGSGVTDGDKGDITVSGSGTAWTIDNNVVTYAKLQNVMTQRLLGRNTPGPGLVEELTPAVAKTMLGLTFSDLAGSATDAQIPNLNTLGTGLTGTRCVQTDGAGLLSAAAGACGISGGAVGMFGAPVAGQLAAWHDGTTIEGVNTLSLAYAATHVAVSGTIATGTEYVTTGGAGVTRTLPPATSGTATRQFRLFKEDVGPGALAITPAGTDTINGATGSLTTSAQWSGFLLQEVSATGWVATPISPTGVGVGGGSALKQVTQLSLASGTVNAPNIGTTGINHIFYRYDVNGTLTVPVPTGTPFNGQTILLRLKPATGFAPQSLLLVGGTGGFCGVAGLTLPTSTGDNTTYVEYGFVYDPNVVAGACWLFDGTTRSTAPTGLGEGGTGQALSDPGNHRLLGWDNTDKQTKWITLDPSLSYNAATDTLSAIGSSATSVRSIFVPAASFELPSTCTLNSSARLVTNGPPVTTVSCTDVDTSEVAFDVNMPDGWNAGTITIELEITYSGTTHNAQVFAMNWSGQCVRDTDALTAFAILSGATATSSNNVATSLTTTGTANLFRQGTSSALTLSGTCAGGAHIYVHGLVNATATTFTPLTDLKLVGAKVEYTRNAAND